MASIEQGRDRLDRTGAEAIKAVPVRHPGRWLAVVILAVLAAQLLHFMVFTKELRWEVVGQYLFEHSVLMGLRNTLILTVVAMVMGIALGVLLAVLRLSANPILSSVSWVYIWFFRGTPVLVQLLFWYNVPAVLKAMSLGIPFGPSWFATDPKTVITQFAAAALGLGLNEAAYMAEIARAGILSVDEGQSEAASALGMSRGLTMRRIVLPQAMRVIIPPTGNETISMLKTSSLASVIGYTELTYAVQIIYANNYLPIPMLIVASIWYLVLTSILTVGQYYLERHYARGTSRNLPPTPVQRLGRFIGRGSETWTGVRL